MAAHKTHDAVARLLRVGAGEMQPLIGPDVAFGGHVGAELTASGATNEAMEFRHLESVSQNGKFSGNSDRCLDRPECAENLSVDILRNNLIRKVGFSISNWASWN
jgi:hypothetical protein